MSHSQLSRCAIILVTPNIEKAASYSREVMGFRVVEYYDRAEKFAALYRDAVEIVWVQAQFGKAPSNRAQSGTG